MIRVLLPFHLRTLAQCDAEVELSVPAPATALSLIEALEKKYPTLRGAVLDLETRTRRPKVRFFACKEDISHDAMSAPLPREVVDGDEPFMIIGAISGG
ncbi:MAG: MoaD/ThiS family protein [Pseudohongiellaceae bacterium]